MIDVAFLEKTYLEKGYELFRFHSGLFKEKLNITGWRTVGGEINRFNDFISVAWEIEPGDWDMRVYPATTVPGITWLKKLLNPKGAAILVPGQYLNCFEIGISKGSTVLRQRKPFKVYRDNNLDNVLDMGTYTIEEGMFGIHIHRAGTFSQYIDSWSAGCQVFQKLADFDDFLSICNKYKAVQGNSFTYTLVDYGK